MRTNSRRDGNKTAALISEIFAQVCTYSMSYSSADNIQRRVLETTKKTCFAIKTGDVDDNGCTIHVRRKKKLSEEKT